MSNPIVRPPPEFADIIQFSRRPIRPGFGTAADAIYVVDQAPCENNLRGIVEKEGQSCPS
jgi:hypothetical protein